MMEMNAMMNLFMSQQPQSPNSYRLTFQSTGGCCGDPKAIRNYPPALNNNNNPIITQNQWNECLDVLDESLLPTGAERCRRKFFLVFPFLGMGFIIGAQMTLIAKKPNTDPRAQEPALPPAFIGLLVTGLATMFLGIIANIVNQVRSMAARKNRLQNALTHIMNNITPSVQWQYEEISFGAGKRRTTISWISISWAAPVQMVQQPVIMMVAANGNNNMNNNQAPPAYYASGFPINNNFNNNSVSGYSSPPSTDKLANNNDIAITIPIGNNHNNNNNNNNNNTTINPSAPSAVYSYCGQCGHSMPEGFKFCGKCGFQMAQQ